MTVDMNTIVFTIFGILLSIISYFLLNVHSDFKENKKENAEHKQKTTEDIGKLKGQIELAQQEQRLRYQQIEERTQLELQNLTSNVNRLTTTVEKFIKYSKDEK